jgi:hypothetical protein
MNHEPACIKPNPARRAGRPAIDNKAKIRSIRLTDSEYIQFKLLGGAEWLRKFIAIQIQLKGE